MTAPKQSLRHRVLVAAHVVLFCGAWISHFVSPAPYVRIVPPWGEFLGGAAFLVVVSWVFEILGGIGLVHPRTRKIAAFGLFALLLAVFPANVHMALEGLQLNPDAPMPTWVAWARLPLQGVLLATVGFIARRAPPLRPDPSTAHA